MCHTRRTLSLVVSRARALPRVLALTRHVAKRRRRIERELHAPGAVHRRGHEQQRPRCIDASRTREHCCRLAASVVAAVVVAAVACGYRRFTHRLLAAHRVVHEAIRFLHMR